MDTKAEQHDNITDKYNLSGTCITIKPKDYMVWWNAFRKYYFDTQPTEKDPKIEMLWEDTMDGTGKIIDTVI